MYSFLGYLCAVTVLRVTTGCRIRQMFLIIYILLFLRLLRRSTKNLVCIYELLLRLPLTMRLRMLFALRAIIY